MNDRLELWRQIHESFEWQIIPGIDSSPQAAMERIAMKCLGLDVRQPFNALNSSVREEALDSTSLNGLVLKHDRAKPRHPGGAIVVLLYEGRRFVIDGNNRVGEWLEQKSKGPFRAIVVEPLSEEEQQILRLIEEPQGEEFVGKPTSGGSRTSPKGVLRTILDRTLDALIIVGGLVLVSVIFGPYIITMIASVFSFINGLIWAVRSLL